MADWYSYHTLFQCWQSVKKKKSAGGLDNRSIRDFSQRSDQRLRKLGEQLAAGKYLPAPGKRVYLKKGGGEKRPISLGTIEDKIVQMAVKQYIEPRFEKEFLDVSYAYRAGKGHRKAIRRVRHHLSQQRTWITTCDIDDFFDSINHARLFEKLGPKISDAKILELIGMWLKIGAFFGDKYVESTEGVPQGGVISPLLSNIYLHDFDREMLKLTQSYVRYADDFIILEKNEQKAQACYRAAEAFLCHDLKLKLNRPEKPVFRLEDGFTFLGIRFYPDRQVIAPEKYRKASAKIDHIFARGRGKALAKIVDQLNETIRGWQYYYAESKSELQFKMLQEKIFEKLGLLLSDMKREARLPERDYLQRHLQRLTLLVSLPSAEHKNILGKLVRGEAITKSPAKARKSAVTGEIPDNKKPAGKKSKREKAGTTAVKQKVSRRVRKYQRHFASEYDLVLSSHGLFLGKHSERLMVRWPNKRQKKYAVSKIKHVLVLNSSISISSAAVYLCAKNDIPIDYLDFSGKPFARLAAPDKPAWRFGGQQLQALKNGKGANLAKGFVEGKIRNQLNLIKYYGKYYRESDPDFSTLFEKESHLMEGYIDQVQILDEDMKLETLRGKLLGLEGRAASAYWALVRHLVKKRIAFKRREHRGTQDPFNVMLNYGYGILYSRVWGALMRAGLNVQVSFLHAPQYQKPTLVFDLIEEFRAQVIDRPVISMVNRGEKLNLRKGLLSKKSKGLLVENIFERLNTPVKFAGQQRTLQEVIQYQARRIGRYLDDEIPSYQPFIGRW